MYMYCNTVSALDSIVRLTLWISCSGVRQEEAFKISDVHVGELKNKSPPCFYLPKLDVVITILRRQLVKSFVVHCESMS